MLRSGKVGTQNGVQVQLADIFEDDGAPRFTGTALGELLVSSPALFLGYWGEQEATEKVLERDTDGIVRYMAGDVARFDPETERYEIVDRLKDAVKMANGEFKFAWPSSTRSWQ